MELFNLFSENIETVNTEGLKAELSEYAMKMNEALEDKDFESAKVYGAIIDDLRNKIDMAEGGGEAELNHTETSNSGYFNSDYYARKIEDQEKRVEKAEANLDQAARNNSGISTATMLLSSEQRLLETYKRGYEMALSRESGSSSVGSTTTEKSNISERESNEIDSKDYNKNRESLGTSGKHDLEQGYRNNNSIQIENAKKKIAKEEAEKQAKKIAEEEAKKAKK